MKSVPTVTLRREVISTEVRATKVNGRTEMMPSDPFEVVKILRDRRSKSPGGKARARLVKEQKRRGL